MINVARRLLHIDIFTKNAIEKSIFDVGLVKGPLVGQRKYNTNNNSLNNKTKSISIVETRDISVTLGNKMSLESLDRAIRKIFGSKHPFGAPNVGVGRARDQNPDAVMLQISNFFIHGGKPGKILSSRFEALKLSRGKKCRKKASGAEDTKICGVATLQNTSLSTCEHGMITDQIGGDRNRRDRLCHNRTRQCHGRKWTRDRSGRRGTWNRTKIIFEF